MSPTNVNKKKYNPWLLALMVVLGFFTAAIIYLLFMRDCGCDENSEPSPMDKTVQVEVMQTINGISALAEESFHNILRNAPDSEFTTDKRSSLNGAWKGVVSEGDSLMGEVMKPVDWETFFKLRDTYLEKSDVFFTTSIEEFRSYAKIDVKEYETLHDKLEAITWDE